MFDLPTEAQWEYACDAAKSAFYSGLFKDGFDASAWYRSNSNRDIHDVGKKLPNRWGLYDMHGNVREMCLDWLGSLPKGMAIDPVGPGSGTERVLKGGGHDSEPSSTFVWAPEDCSAVWRGSTAPTNGRDDTGFRLALTIND